jgi:hypothetical protein
MEVTGGGGCSDAGAPWCSRDAVGGHYDDYGKIGIITNPSTSNIKLQDLNIHGFAGRGINGPIGGLVTVQNVRVAGNGLAGWDMDDGSGTQNGVNAAIEATNLLVEWNGCVEVPPQQLSAEWSSGNPTSTTAYGYPWTYAYNYPYTSCYDQTHGGYGDGWSTIGSGTGGSLFDHVTFDQSIFRYNTQDGLDLLHQQSGNYLYVTRSIAYGNMGNQFKLGAFNTMLLENSIAIGNCYRMSVQIGDAPSGWNTNLSDFCRAKGDAVVFSPGAASTVIADGNTALYYGNVGFNSTCGSSCTAGTIDFHDNIAVAYNSPGNTDHDGTVGSSWYLSAGNGTLTDTYNLLYNTSDCGSGGTGNVCADPLLTSIPSGPAYSSETAFDSLDLSLTSSSPAKQTGTSVTGLTVDYDGNARLSPPSMGALEYGSAGAFTLVQSGSGATGSAFTAGRFVGVFQ